MARKKGFMMDGKKMVWDRGRFKTEENVGSVSEKKGKPSKAGKAKKKKGHKARPESAEKKARYEARGAELKKKAKSQMRKAKLSKALRSIAKGAVWGGIEQVEKAKAKKRGKKSGKLITTKELKKIKKSIPKK